MKKKIKFFLTIIFVIFGLMFSVSQSSHADAGSFRGNKSYSRGNFSKSFKGFKWSSNKNRNNYSSGSSSGGSIIDTLFGFTFFGLRGMTPFIIVILYIILKRVLTTKYKGDYDRDDVDDEYRFDKESFMKLMEKDENFSMEDFKKYVSRVYVEMQDCWMNKDFEPMRAYMKSEVFSQIENQLNQLKKDGYTNIIKNISVLGIDPIKYSEDSENQIIKLILSTRMVDYTVDENDEVVVGSKTEEVFMTYLYTMVRDINAKTEVEQKESNIMICESCGATIDVHQSARCKYCGRITEVKSSEWAINNIEALRQE